MNNVTANHLICNGKDELYKWDDICRYNAGDDGIYAYSDSYRLDCQLKDGDILQLNPQ